MKHCVREGVRDSGNEGGWSKQRDSIAMGKDEEDELDGIYRGRK